MRKGAHKGRALHGMIRLLRVFIHRHPKIVNCVLVLLSLTFVFTVMEVVFRVYLQSQQPGVARVITKFGKWSSLDDTELKFVSHPYLSYAPSEIKYDDGGLWIREQFFSNKKSPDVVRIACLGGSTTMRKYPAHLQRVLNRRPGNLKFEVMDFGCNGWTLMESTINFLIRVSAFQPDIVLLHHAANESPPRQWPNYKPDYSHFRKSWNNPRLGFFTRRVLSGSWMASYLMWRSGLSAFEVQNLVINRVQQDQIHGDPAPGSIETIKQNLRHLAVMAQSIDAKLLVAPMPYYRKRGKPAIQQMIHEFNQCSRMLARERDLPIAETDALMQQHTDWFADWVHVKENGDFLKAQVYAMVIWDMLGLYPEKEEISPIKIFGCEETAAPLGRDLEIQWEFDAAKTKEFIISVRKEKEKEFKVLGRTPSGNEQSFRWKSGAPQLSYSLDEQFVEGPQFGHDYYFKVVAISNEYPHKVIGHLTSKHEVKTLERPWQ